MSVWGVASNRKDLLDGFDGGAACEENPKSLNHRTGEFGDIGEGGFDDFAIDAFGFSNEPGGVGISVGDFGDIHGYIKFNANDPLKPVLGEEIKEKTVKCPQYQGARAN